MSLEIAGAVTQVLGLWESFRAYIPAIEKLADVDAKRVGKLRDYALNLIYWQGSATYATAPNDGLSAMAESGMAVRDRVMSDLKALSNHGVLEASLLEKFRGTNSHRKLGQDLIGLSNLVHERWADLRGKSMITLEAMDEAARLGETILQSIGDRERAPTSAAQLLIQRDKAFTLFSRAYDEARRAILFLRWHEGDADTILPSLYAGRRSSKKRETEADGAPAAAKPAPAAQVPASPLSAEDDPFTA